MGKNAKKLLLIFVLLTIVLGTTVVFSEPGSNKDPLVSLSYLEKSIEELKSYIDNKIGDGIQGNSANQMEVVELKAEQILLGKSGTEIILRCGKAQVIAGERGGLSDITDGKDLDMGVDMPTNHLLIVPRDDGRGAYVISDAIFLVRGEYEIY